MSRFYCLLILASSSLFVNAQGALDGFFKSKGEIDVALSGSYAHSDIYFAGTEEINYTRSQIIASGYAVFGVTDRLNVAGSLPLINFQPQDLGLYAKYKLLDAGGLTIAPAAGITFPVFPYSTESGQSIGSRAVVIQPRLITQFTGNHWFIQAQGGYNYALNPVPSSYGVSGKIGYFGDKWYVDAWYDFQHGIGGKDYLQPNAEPLTSFRELGVSYQRVGGVVYYQSTPKRGYFINASRVLDGRNISKFFSIGGGIVLKFNTSK